MAVLIGIALLAGALFDLLGVGSEFRPGSYLAGSLLCVGYFLGLGGFARYVVFRKKVPVWFAVIDTVVVTIGWFGLMEFLAEKEFHPSILFILCIIVCYRIQLFGKQKTVEPMPGNTLMAFSEKTPHDKIDAPLKQRLLNACRYIIGAIAAFLAINFWPAHAHPIKSIYLKEYGVIQHPKSVFEKGSYIEIITADGDKVHFAGSYRIEYEKPLPPPIANSVKSAEEWRREDMSAEAEREIIESDMKRLGIKKAFENAESNHH